MNKSMIIFSGIPEALAEGVMTFPLYLFTALFYYHFGEFDFILPFVLWYTFQRIGVFLISCFGTVKNPYKICFYELLIASIGCLIIIFGVNFFICWNIGAILIGFGISGYASMYRTTRDEMQDRDILNFNGSMTSGYVFFLLAIILTIVVGLDNILVSIVIMSVLIFGSLIYVALLWSKNPYGDECLFHKNETNRGTLVSALVIMLFAFSVRLYRQTADIWIVVLLPIIFILVLYFGNRYRTQPYRGNSMRTLWYGAAINFLYVFSLFYFSSVGDFLTIGIVYFMIGLGSAASMIGPSIFKKFIPSEKYEAFA